MWVSEGVRGGMEGMRMERARSSSRMRCRWRDASGRCVRGADGEFGALALTGRLTVMRLSCKVSC